MFVNVVFKLVLHKVHISCTTQISLPWGQVPKETSLVVANTLETLNVYHYLQSKIPDDQMKQQNVKKNYKQLYFKMCQTTEN